MGGLHVAIAGAGLAGRLLAWRLLRAGCRVTLLDVRSRAAQDTASMVAAAMLSPLAELAVSDAVVFELGQRSMALWPQWIEELQASSPAAAASPVYYRQQGSLVVAHAPDQSSLAHFTRLLQHKLPAAFQQQVQSLDAAQLATLEPALAGRFGHGLHLQGEGQLANDQWMVALAHALDRLGVVWHEGVTVHTLQANRLLATRGPEALEIAADLVVDARGVGSKPLLGELRGVRGEVLRVECRGVVLQRPVRLMHPRYQLYVVPRPDNVFVVGATELESEDSGPITLRSMLELGSALYSLHPAFGEARVLQASAALRPALDNDQPACTLRDGVWHINGLYRHGYLCAPALVESLMHTLEKLSP
ncbi:glycine oxidase ThiO [Rhodoferax lacus]|uniref:D-amino-acid oxidase n=1 Tax=Rhodoferax lacus TaxID=2184758 RepID=A0A3E1REY1_9BURK|nr:glycine oxidase ThiO [Rhodoferax lacus]